MRNPKKFKKREGHGSLEVTIGPSELFSTVEKSQTSGRTLLSRVTTSCTVNFPSDAKVPDSDWRARRRRVLVRRRRAPTGLDQSNEVKEGGVHSNYR